MSVIDGHRVINLYSLMGDEGSILNLFGLESNLVNVINYDIMATTYITN